MPSLWVSICVIFLFLLKSQNWQKRKASLTQHQRYSSLQPTWPMAERNHPSSGSRFDLVLIIVASRIYWLLLAPEVFSWLVNSPPSRIKSPPPPVYVWGGWRSTFGISRNYSSPYFLKRSFFHWTWAFTDSPRGAELQVPVITLSLFPQCWDMASLRGFGRVQVESSWLHHKHLPTEPSSASPSLRIFMCC